MGRNARAGLWVALALSLGCEQVNFTVDTLADLSDADPGDGQCAGANGACSLRAAVQEANAQPPGRQITILLSLPGEYQLTVDTGTNEGLALDAGGKSVVINGCCGSPESTTIRPTHQTRIFTIQGGATTLNRVRLTGGRVEGDDGGAIHIGGAGARLFIDESILEDNRAASGRGGAIFFENDPATVLSITDSEILDNAAATAGIGGAGGVQSGATTFVTRTLFRGNVGQGGGLAIEEPDGVSSFVDHEITGSTFRENTTGSGGGGGGVVVTIDGRVVISNSTFSQNASEAVGGGGIAVGSGTVVLNHTTMARNVATSRGHALWVRNGQARLTASLLVQNPFPTSEPRSQISCDDTDEVVLSGFNLVDGIDEDCPFSSMASDEVGADGPIDANIGGYQETPFGHHPLLPDSPAIDHAEFFCSGTDQLGNPRPVDGDGDSITRCDAGSIEFQGT